MTESVNAPLPPSIFGLPEEILEVLGPEVVARIESVPLQESGSDSGSGKLGVAVR